ncbi:MAG: hypothetical protein L3K19_04095 [Thermoplasmata archaeon]|nr:hypothetical protein [Thermoplasmata archaeon]
MVTPQAGKTPTRPPRDVEESRAERRNRAVEEPLDVRLREGVAFLAFDVRNPVRLTRYLVVAPAFPRREGALCTCTDFNRRGIGTCKHLEAAWLWMEEHPGTRPAGPCPRSRVSWEEIEQAVGERPASDLSGSRSLHLRRPGRLLFAPAS